MMKKPMPNMPEPMGDNDSSPNPYPNSQMPPPMASSPHSGNFNKYHANVDFLHKIHNMDYPHKGAGAHVPMWLSPALAAHVMKMHGHTGHAIPHPNIDLNDITK